MIVLNRFPWTYGRLYNTDICIFAIILSKNEEKSGKIFVQGGKISKASLVITY